MGFYERDYEREYNESPGVHLGAPKTMTTTLVLVTAGVYLAQLLFGDGFTSLFKLWSDWFKRPWECYALLSYGFLHEPRAIQHIFWNMLGLWIFGRDVENRYGRREYLFFYLSAIVFAGLVWSLLQTVSGAPAPVYGASGGVAAVLILFALNFPHRTVLFMFLFPMPMWVLACIVVGMDIVGTMRGSDPLRGGNVAFTAHLAGASFAYLYYRWAWSPGLWLADKFSGVSFQRKPKLRIHEPGMDEDNEDEMSKILDPILKKIQDHGQDSLTWREKRILKKASEEYQRKRN